MSTNVEAVADSAPITSTSKLLKPGAAQPASPDSAPGADWRLRKHADYQRVYRASRKQFGALMAYFAAPRTQDSDAAKHCARPRVGLTAGRVLGKAVERNRIKRRMRAAACKHLALLPPATDVVLHPKRAVLDAEFAAIEADVARIFRKLQAAHVTPATAATGKSRPPGSRTA